MNFAVITYGVFDNRFCSLSDDVVRLGLVGTWAVEAVFRRYAQLNRYRTRFITDAYVNGVIENRVVFTVDVHTYYNAVRYALRGPAVATTARVNGSAYARVNVLIAAGRLNVVNGAYGLDVTVSVNHGSYPRERIYYYVPVID